MFLSISYLEGAPRYWVGGSGDWSDQQHWSAVSGGPGGASVPTSADDVFFDDNSFNGAGQAVNIDADVFCRDMIWMNTGLQPALTGAAAWTVEISGSLAFSVNMNHQFLGSYRFVSGNNGNTITSNGQTFNQDVIFDNANGGWTLTDDFVVLHSIGVTSGTFDTGVDGYRVEAQRFVSNSDLPRLIRLNASFLRLDQTFSPGPTLLELSGDNLAIDFGASVINLYGDVGDVVLAGPTPFVFNLLVFEATNGRLSSMTDVRPYFDQIDFNHNGEIRGDHQMRALRLANGFTYILENGSRQVLTDLLTGDDCDGLVNILAMLGSDEQAIIQFTNIPPRIDGLYLRGIRADNNPDVILSFSSDGGNNDGWFFDNLVERDLYWVGGSGDWNDPNNWSETSGGPGGACIPTNVDRVIFDQNSFDSPDDIVTGASPGYCNDFLFDVVSFRGSLILPDLYVNNDLLLLTTVDWQVENIYLIGNDEAGFSDAQEIETTQNELINLVSLSKRDVVIRDNLALAGDLIIQGTAVFKSNGNLIRANRMLAENATVRLQLADSYITITGDRNGIDMPLTIVSVGIASTTGTTFELTAAMSGFHSNMGPLGRILFSNPDGTGVARSTGGTELTTLSFKGNGLIQEGTIKTDTLLFSAGKTYQINGQSPLMVNNYFESRGEICQPITFESSVQGVYSTFVMPTPAKVDMQYTQIGFVRASGGALFDTGMGSSEKADSPGWIFPTDDDNNVITQYLGLDRTLCSDTTLILRPFEANEIVSILWKNGSNDLNYEVPVTGDTVIATVQFLNTCVVTDTVMIDFDEAFEIDLGRDTILCEGESLNLDVTTPGASYLWQDNSTEAGLNVITDGLYRVEVERGACFETSSILVNYNTLAPVDLGRDTAICEDKTLTLDPGPQSGAEFEWQDGSNLRTFTPVSSGLYWVEVSKGRCTYRDSVNLRVDAVPLVDLAQDTVLCEDESILIGQNFPGGTYLWNTGDTASFIAVSDPDDYALTITNGRCQSSDAITIAVNILNPFDLGQDTTLCEGETLTLSAGLADGDLSWNDGSTEDVLMINVQGIYWLTSSKGRCAITDSIDVFFDTKPDLDLGSDTVLCEDESILIGQNFPGGTYLWNTGDTASFIAVSDPDDYALTITNGRCQSSDVITISVNTLNPFDLGQDTTLCEGETLILSAGLADGDLSWNDGSTEDDFLVNAQGTYWLTSSKGRCAITDSIDVFFETKPDLDLGSDTLLCEDQSLVLSTGDIMGLTVWNTGENSPNITVSNEGLYAVTIMAGACVVSDSISVDVALLPEIDLGIFPTQCEGRSITLNAPSSPEAERLWSDGTSGPSLRATATGLYWLEMRIGHCAARDSANLFFDPAPVFDIGNDTTVCPGDTIVLTTGLTDAFHRWNNGTESNSITVTEGGDYGVFVQMGVCTSQQIIEVEFVDLDNIRLGPDTTLCEGKTLVLAPQFGPGYTVNWEGFPGQSALDVTMPGSYILEAGTEGCLAYDTIVVDFQSPPEAMLPKDTLICAGTQVTLDAGPDGLNYLWSNLETTSEIDVMAGGEYSVQIVDGVCTTLDTVFVTVQSLPVPSLPEDTIACRGTSVVLDTRVIEGEHLWENGASESILTVDTDGIYIVHVSINGCAASDTAIVTYQEVPVIDLGGDQSICQGESILIGQQQNGLSYAWNTGDQNAFIEAEDAGAYIVTVTQTEGASCTASDSMHLTVRPIPVFDLGTETVVCEGESTNIEVDGDFDDYLWSTSETTRAISVSTSGLVWAEASLDNCFYRDSVAVRIQPFPVFSLGPDTLICDGTTLRLDASVTGSMYEWNTGETTAQIDVSSEGTYQVSVSISGCTSEDELTLSTKPVPMVDLGEDIVICENETTMLEVSNSQWDIVWSTGESTPAIQVSTAGKYTATAFLDGCAGSDEVQVDVQQLPVFNVGDDILKCEENDAIITADRSDVDIVWSDGTVGPTLVVSDPGQYTATAMTDIGCIYETSIVVSNRECISFNAYIPNAFSPNGDGQNDFLRVEIPPSVILHSFHMSVFDRWGNVLFSTRDPAAFWDGRYNGDKVKPGVYIVMAEVLYSDDFSQNKKEVIAGDVTLLN